MRYYLIDSEISYGIIGQTYKDKVSSMSQNYTWDDTYAIARILEENHPDVELENVTLNMIYEWTISLDTFSDDPKLVNDQILTNILQEWYEEENN